MTCESTDCSSVPVKVKVKVNVNVKVELERLEASTRSEPTRTKAAGGPFVLDFTPGWLKLAEGAFVVISALELGSATYGFAEGGCHEEPEVHPTRHQTTMFDRAQAAALAGDCATVRTIVQQVDAYAPDYRERVFVHAADPRVRALSWLARLRSASSRQRIISSFVSTR